MAATNDKTRIRGTPERARGELLKPAPASADGDPSGGNIDQIRDIIFGAQMRDYDQRFSRLEERLLKESVELREDLKKRLSALEDYLKKEVESLTSELRSEQRLRTTALKELATDLSALAKSADDKSTKLEELTVKGQRELRAQLMEQSKTLGDTIQKKHTDLTAAWQRESADLRNAKADRSAIAALLSEMARRLTDEIKRPENAGK